MFISSIVADALWLKVDDRVKRLPIIVICTARFPFW